MKPPVDYVRISTKGKNVLQQVKNSTRLEHWNEICRIALYHSLANPLSPPKPANLGENAIDMDWKTFAGTYSEEITSAVLLRAYADSVNVQSREAIADYFKAHLERGIASLRNVEGLIGISNLKPH